eukprot:4372543-Alexandrium_andersonii.AAC.1
MKSQGPRKDRAGAACLKLGGRGQRRRHLAEGAEAVEGLEGTRSSKVLKRTTAAWATGENGEDDTRTVCGILK